MKRHLYSLYRFSHIIQGAVFPGFCMHLTQLFTSFLFKFNFVYSIV